MLLRLISSLDFLVLVLGLLLVMPTLVLRVFPAADLRLPPPLDEEGSAGAMVGVVYLAILMEAFGGYRGGPFTIAFSFEFVLCEN